VNEGLCLAGMGKTDEAEVAYGRALGLDPRHPEALNNLGVLMFQERRYAEAREFFAAATAARPAYEDAWFNLRDACSELGLGAECAAASARFDELSRRKR